MELAVADREEALQIPDKRFTRVRGANGGVLVEAEKIAISGQPTVSVAGRYHHCCAIM
jgi:hypothetical protein